MTWGREYCPKTQALVLAQLVTTTCLTELSMSPSKNTNVPRSSLSPPPGIPGAGDARRWGTLTVTFKAELLEGLAHLNPQLVRSLVTLSYSPINNIY